MGYWYNAQDAVMYAVVVACTRKEPPENLQAYFFKVAKNYASNQKKRARQETSCDRIPQEDEHYYGRCVVANQSAEEREETLAALWKTALCGVDELTAEVIKDRLIGGHRYRDIGARRGLTEAQARNLFNNAIKKFRNRADLCFLAAELRP